MGKDEGGGQILKEPIEGGKCWTASGRRPRKRLSVPDAMELKSTLGPAECGWWHPGRHPPMDQGPPGWVGFTKMTWKKQRSDDPEWTTW